MKRELKAVVDTNIFISALLGGKFASDIVDSFIEGEFCLVISELLIKELRRTLHKPKIFPSITESEAFELIFFIRAKGRVVTPLKSLEICRDPKDNPVLEAAIEGKADFIITSDKDLLVLNPFRSISIVSPKEFLKILSKS